MQAPKRVVGKKRLISSGVPENQQNSVDNCETWANCYRIMTTAWIFLLLAGLMEIVWAVTLKFTHGLTRFWPTAVVVAALGLSIFFMALSLKHIPLGTAYAIWFGIGSVGTAAVGILFFQESRDPLRLLCLGLILAGVVGLKFLTRE
jgi:quaternary ammonium compound-resistance protein SugE